MSVEHKDLSGSSVHEPKGIATAATNTVYTADGSGSGTWSDPVGSINNKNLLFLAVKMDDISSASSVFIPVPLASKVTKITVVTDAAYTGTNVITAQVVPSGSSTGTSVTGISISCVGTNANTVSSGTSSSNNALGLTDTLKITSDGGGATASTATLVITLDVS